MSYLRYPCLILDHDDTVVDSTAHVHYPAYLDAMAQMRPDIVGTVSLQDYFRINFKGFLPYIRDELHFSDEELKREYAIWQGWVKRTVPAAYPGMAYLIRRYTKAGGTICVVSHSVADNIRRDWAANDLPEPAVIFGWEQPPERRKPSAWPVEQIRAKLGFSAEELLMVDDSGPGFEMAQAAGIDFAAAMWAYDVPEVRDFMRTHTQHCFTDPADLESWLFTP